MVGDEIGDEGRIEPEDERDQAAEAADAPEEEARDAEAWPQDAAEGGLDNGGGRREDPESDAPTSRDWDAEWAGITSGLHLREVRHLRGDVPRSGAGVGPRDYSPREMTAAEIDADARYEPPVPTIPRGTRATRLAWAGIGSGLLLLLLGVLAFSQAPTWFFLLCLALVVAGCVALFTRLPARRTDEGDDGAQV